VLGFEVSLQPEPPITAIPEPQFTGGGGFLAVARGRAVRIEVREDAPTDLVQCRGIE
jgi:hypothetical protein